MHFTAPPYHRPNVQLCLCVCRCILSSATSSPFFAVGWFRSLVLRVAIIIIIIAFWLYPVPLNGRYVAYILGPRQLCVSSM